MSSNEPSKELTNAKKKKKRKRRIRFILFLTWSLFIFGFIAIPLYVYSVSINFNNWYGEMPSITVLENPEQENSLASELYTVDGLLLGKYYRENRSPVSYDELSPNLVGALLATEDFRFHQHSGIDFQSLPRVLFYSIIAGQNTGGGSTISQQLAKNLFKTRTDKFEGSLSNVPGLSKAIVKTKEWLLASILEKNYTKEEIIAMYLNTVDFGSNSFGIKVASNTFFGTTPDKLKVEQAAILVGLLKAPTYYSPVLHPDNALRRRNVVLGQMLKYGYIRQDSFNVKKALPIELNYEVESHNKGLATYFRAVAQNYLLNWSKSNGYDLFADGLKIYTTIDSRLQGFAEKAVEEHLSYLQEVFFEVWEGEEPWRNEDEEIIENFAETIVTRTKLYKKLVEEFGVDADTIESIINTPKPMRVFSWAGEIDTVLSPIDSIRYYNHFLHTGFMAMDPHSGHIKAWVGGINHKHFKFDHVYQGRRQPGSTFKPFVYSAAIDNGYSPCYEVYDTPITFELPPNSDPPTWTPQNTDLKFTGDAMTIRQALARSINSATAFLMKKVDPNTVVGYAKRMGIESPLDPVPALCLGVSNVSVFEMVGAYSTFANKGTYIRPYFITRIEDKNGNVIKEFIPNTREALSEETAFTMLYMLRGTSEESGGTALGLDRELRQENHIAAKTGTTQNYSDGWFMGVTKDLVAGAWVGADNITVHFKSLYYGQGARMALPIWEKFMLQVYADSTLGYEKGEFTPPSNFSLNLDCGPGTQAEADSTLMEDGFEIMEDFTDDY